MTTGDQRRAWVLTKLLCGELSVREVATFRDRSGWTSDVRRRHWRLGAHKGRTECDQRYARLRVSRETAIEHAGRRSVVGPVRPAPNPAPAADGRGPLAAGLGPPSRARAGTGLLEGRARPIEARHAPAQGRPWPARGPPSTVPRGKPAAGTGGRGCDPQRHLPRVQPHVRRRCVAAKACPSPSGWGVRRGRNGRLDA